ncbi:MAG TPA: hypothetical protein VK302_21635 [Terriglobales bacterium]|nr:hypothetical protein [Terriglobales bacterium]
MFSEGNHPLTVGTKTRDTVTLSPGHFYVEKGYDPTVRVPDEVLKSVAFIGEVVHQDEHGNVFGDLLATGFFVSIPAKHFPELRHVYFVTAKHVALDLKDRPPYILVNSKDGGQTHLTNFFPYWYFHPTDQNADVAVLQVADQPNVAYRTAVLTRNFVTQEDIASRKWVDIGDEVFVTGLFTPAPGQHRNMPLVRHGNIAMIPDEQIQTDLGFSDLYLVEGRSIGGLSGSPVFVRRTETFKLELQGRLTEVNCPGPYKLLGLMQGHWDIKESEINKPLIQHDRKHGVNLGIAIVTPAMKISEILNQPAMTKYREASEEDLGRHRGSVPGADSARKSDEQPFTQKDFEAALKKASRKITTATTK